MPHISIFQMWVIERSSTTFLFPPKNPWSLYCGGCGGVVGGVGEELPGEDPNPELGEEPNPEPGEDPNPDVVGELAPGVLPNPDALPAFAPNPVEPPPNSAPFAYNCSIRGS
jgi:hypothetical protein